MAKPELRFSDGAAYERTMGVWSRLAGDVFLDWLAPEAGLAWVDVGCGNGAFTEAIVARTAPAAVEGVDPSDGQIDFARKRAPGSIAGYRVGDAMALPFPDDHFDAATMALVIFFVPEPATGVAELVRVTRPGGRVAAYVWDMYGAGFPLEPLLAEMRAMGMTPPMPPSMEASRLETLRGLWSAAGLGGIETREITVERTFADFTEFWSTVLGSSFARAFADLDEATRQDLETRVRTRLSPAADGTLTTTAHAFAIQGRVAG